MITVRNVTRHYGSTRAVDHVSLVVPDGASTVVFGPSGCGKTTLLRLVAGLERPDEGEVYLGGELVSNSTWARSPHRRNVSVVFQEPTLWPHMTVAQNVAFGLGRMPRAVALVRVRELLKAVALAGFEDRYPSELSGGEARRVALARGLAPTRLWLLMDEPLTNLDSALRGELLVHIRHHVARTGCTLLYVTHDMAEALALTDHVVYMEEGRLVQRQRRKHM